MTTTLNRYDRLQTLRCNSLRELTPQQWNIPSASQPLLDYDLLSMIENPKVNNLKHFYLRILGQDRKPVGRANAYIAPTDFATIETGMSSSMKTIIRSIKQLFPGFMSFNMLECGFFTTMGEGLEIAEPYSKKTAIETVADELEQICKEDKVDFLFFRDIPLESYETYKNVLAPRGYLPTFGFANAVLDVKWNDLEEFLKSFKSKDRLKLKNSLLFTEKFDIECKIMTDYDHLTKDLAKLWNNVYKSSGDYSREILDEKFFAACSRLLKDKSEVITFWYEGELVAFLLNVFNGDEYFVLDWGVNYDFEHYRKSNLYRAASLLSVQQAIKHQKKKMPFGITNYVPKKLLGAEIVPLIYFVKHVNNSFLTYNLASSIMTQIVQPDFSDYFDQHPNL
ncbi:MAG: 8-amino-7-oxononanoate synthase, partial [Moorea sp. SIO4A3]|nr:8-amino-7-oxononanoate synthase [Moorena sp. SIO4A3]